MKKAKPIAFDVLKAKPVVPPFIEIVQYWGQLLPAKARSMQMPPAKAVG